MQHCLELAAAFGNGGIRDGRNSTQLPSDPRCTIRAPCTRASDMPYLPKELEALRLYYATYDLLYAHVGRLGDRRTHLGSGTGRVCRFCRQNDVVVSFRTKAHAIPEAFGNKTLFTNYECDQCNQLFGTTIENDLGAYTKPARVFARIRGKRSVPSLKQHGSVEHPWRVDVEKGVIHFTEYEDDPLVKIVREGNRVELVVTRDAYTPIAVMKAFVRIGLTLVPESELPNFPDTLDWIRETDHGRRGRLRTPAAVTFRPGPMPNDVIGAAVLRRKAAARKVPYAFVVLAFGNHQYQVCIPSVTQDREPFDTGFRVPPRPMVFGVDPAEYGHPRPRSLDLSGTTPVRGHKVHASLHYDRMIESVPPSG